VVGGNDPTVSAERHLEHEISSGFPSGKEILIFDLFTGIDGLGWALESLGALPNPRVGVLMFETDPHCRATLRDRRPHAWLSDYRDSSGKPGSVFALADNDFELVRDILKANPGVKHISVVGGSPCVGFSSANPHRRGINDPHSNALWILPVLVSTLSNRVSPGTTVGFIIENVDSMRAEDKEAISKTIGVKPIMMDAARYSPVTRARLFWTNYQQPNESQLPGIDSVGMNDVLESGWAPLWTMSGGTAHDSFKTFLRPFPVGAPPECKDATFWRFPLNSYDERGLVFKAGADPGELRKLRDWMVKSVFIPTGDIKSIGSKACEKRLQFAEWIHQLSGDAIVRPLKSFERERALGFPQGSSASRADQHKEFERCGALGNTFSVLVMKRVAFELAQACRGDSPRLHEGGPIVRSAEEALRSLGASSTLPLNGSRRGTPPTSTDPKVAVPPQQAQNSRLRGRKRKRFRGPRPLERTA
jgi:hypothetical protein